MLKREIKRWDLVLLLINGVIGAGIFGLPSKIYAMSGFYSIPALLICALIVFILILNFSEVASRFDQTGGPYLYTLTAFGKLPGFTICWLILITRLATYAALVNLLITYLSFFNDVFNDPMVRIVSITLVTLFFTIVNYLGIKNTTRVNNFLGIAKLLPLFIFIIVGLFFIQPDLIITDQELPKLDDFASSVFVLFFAFTGFEAVLVNTGEIQDPRRNIPFALIVSMTVITIVYGSIQFVSIGTLPDLAASEKPLTDAARLFMGSYGAALIGIGAILSIGGTLNAVMLVGSRLSYALSEGQQMPFIFSRLHPKFGTPIYSLLLFAILALVVSLTGSFIYAVSISVISKVMIFMTVCFALLKLRKDEPEKTNFFKLKYGHLFAILGILASISLLLSSKKSEFIDVVIAVMIGIAFYGMYILSTKRKV